MAILLGTRKGLLILNDEGSIEQFHFAGVKVPFATQDPHSKTIWAGVNHGHWGPKLHFSTNGGESFKEIAAPKFPEGSDISLKDIWNISCDPKGRIYLGVEPAAVFYSDDQGETWQLCENLFNDPKKDQWFGGGSDAPCIHSILIHPNDINHLYIGISCAGVLESKDRGINWNYKNKGLRAEFLPDKNSEVGQDPHLIEISPSHPNILWQQNHCGLFMTENGGTEWQDISEAKGVKSSFGWAVAIDEKDPKTVFTVPSLSDEVRIPYENRLFVQRTRDGGQSWDALTEGLPQENCFDICYRHALSLKEGQLAFGTTTGNLYFSKDYGDSWRAINNHLPPIYSLEIM